MPTPRTRARALAALALVLAVAAAHSARGQAPQATPGTEPQRVLLNVTLTGGKGRAAPDLRREDLRVYVGGVERPVTYFAKEELPASYGLVIDNSGSLKTQLGQVVAAAKFVVGSNRPGDEAFIVRFVSSDNIRVLQDLTGERAALERALDSMAPEGGQTALLDALYLAAGHLQKNAGRTGGAKRRRALLLVTDGEDRVSYYKAEQVLKALKDAGIQVFCVGITGALDREQGFITQSKREKARVLLTKLASETGGRVFFAEKGAELKEAVEEVVDDLHAQYVVGFDRADAPGGKGSGKVEVKVVGAPGKEKLKAVVTPAAPDAGQGARQ